MLIDHDTVSSNGQADTASCSCGGTPSIIALIGHYRHPTVDTGIDSRVRLRRENDGRSWSGFDFEREIVGRGNRAIG